MPGPFYQPSAGGLHLSSDGPMLVHTGTMRHYKNEAGAFKRARWSCGVAPTVSSVTLVIKKNGSAILTLSLTVGLFTITGVPSPADFADGDYLTFDITATDLVASDFTLDLVS